MNSRRIIILKGSPRKKGNSSILADRLAAGAKEAGATVESFDLHKMNIGACDACDICKGDGDRQCIIDDDMQILYPKLRAADAIVIASPIYWFTMSAQTKLCIDRWYVLEGPQGSALKGKDIGILLTYGDTDPYSSGGINAIRTFQDIFRYIKAEIVGIIYGSALGEGDILNQPELLEQAYQLGAKLAG
ncbi:MAG: flavodoxin family protein [candidate division Zixibacteria bacterium]|nr:flavodoxin family protein [candidate division Zixibacteria bacterium]